MTEEVPQWALKKAQEMLDDPKFQAEMREVEASFERGEGILYEVKDGGLYRVSDGVPLYEPDEEDPLC